MPKTIERISEYEKEFGKTIDRELPVHVKAAKGICYKDCTQSAGAALMNEDYTEHIIATSWDLPAGAFKESCGPT